MTLYEQIIAIYPELTITPEKDEFAFGCVEIKDDGDGIPYLSLIHI